MNNLSLLEEQRWRIYYDPESLRAIRNRADLDRFRAPGYFGDVSVIPFSKDRGTLLNEPCSDFGVHKGEMFMIHFAEQEEGRVLVAERGS